MKKTLYEQLDIHETASHEVKNIGLAKAQPSKSEEAPRKQVCAALLTSVLGALIKQCSFECSDCH